MLLQHAIISREVCPWYCEDPAQQSYHPLKLVQQSLRPLEGRTPKGWLSHDCSQATKTSQRLRQERGVGGRIQIAT